MLLLGAGSVCRAVRRAGATLAAGGYEALADAAELADTLQRPGLAGEPPERVYALVAEATSALKSVLTRCGIREDHDQHAVFRWVRDRAAEADVYLPHMSLDDPADAGRWPERRRMIAERRDRLDKADSRAREINNELGRVRYIAGRWAARRPAQGGDHPPE